MSEFKWGFATYWGYYSLIFANHKAWRTWLGFFVANTLCSVLGSLAVVIWRRL